MYNEYMSKQKVKQKAWVVAVDMGYGHQRAAYPLKHLAYKNEIITVNTYPGIPHQDRRIWKESRKFYEFISGFKKTPLVGKKIFQLFTINYKQSLIFIHGVIYLNPIFS